MVRVWISWKDGSLSTFVLVSQAAIDLVTIQLLVCFWKSSSIGRGSGLGLLFGTLPKQKHPYLPPLGWICKWPEKAPILLVLPQQRQRWVCYILLEIPTRCWSLRMTFMQHKPPHTTDCHSALLAAFVKGRLHQIDAVYSICPRIHMNAAPYLINSFQRHVNHTQDNLSALEIQYVKLGRAEICSVSNGSDGFPVVRHTVLEKMDLGNDREPLS